MQNTNHPLPSCVRTQTRLELQQQELTEQMEMVLATLETARAAIFKGVLGIAAAALALAWSAFMWNLGS